MNVPTESRLNVKHENLFALENSAQSMHPMITRTKSKRSGMIRGVFSPKKSKPNNSREYHIGDIEICIT